MFKTLSDIKDDEAHWEPWHSFFGHIQGHSAIFRHVQPYLGTLRHILALLRHIEPYSDIFRTLCKPCIYNRAIFRTLAYSELKASSKACRTFKMIRHIQSPGIEQFFNYFQRYLGIFRDIDACSATLTLFFLQNTSP